MKKIFTLLVLMLAVVTGAKADDVTLLHWRFSGTYEGIGEDISVNGGTLTPLRKEGSTKDFSAGDKIKGYVEDVPNDMKAAGETCLKMGSNDLTIKVTLSQGTFEAGDMIYICGYAGASAGTTERGTEISTGFNTGASNSAYAVGSVALPEGTYTNTIYVQRYPGTTGGFAAMKIVRPDKTKKELTFKFSRESDEVEEGEDVANIVFKAFDGEDDVTSSILSSVSIVSSNEDIATVSGAEVSFDTSTSGSATVKASFDGNDTYKAASATYTITVIPSPVTAVSEKVWDFSTWEKAEYTSATKVDNLEIVGASNKSIKVESGVLKFGGTGSKDSRHVHFKVTGTCDITVVAKHASSNGDDRPLMISFGSFGTDAETLGYVVAAADAKTFTYSYTGDENDIYIYSGNSGINLSSITVAPQSTSVSVTIPASGYATLCSSNDVVSNGECYKATKLVNGVVTIVPVQGVIPSGTGIIVKGEAGTVTLPIATEGTTAADLSDNKMVGVLTDTDMTGKSCYILSDGAFYPCSGGTLAAGKAYLDIAPTSGAKAIEIDVDGQETAISTVNAEQLNGNIYTINGVQVKNAQQKGIYIINGKKVVK